MQVIKKSGVRQSFDADKIKKVVAFAAKGFSVNPLELESKTSIVFKDGVSTTDIQNNLINNALTLSSLESPDWRYVAGRLLMMEYIKNTKHKRKGLEYDDYCKQVHKQVKNNVYDSAILNYSDQELKEAGTWINKSLDMDYDYAGANMLIRRYLLKNELLQECFLTIALLLALPEKKEERLKWARKFYNILSQRKLSLATPILSNLRKPNGNLSSCFIIKLNDDLDSIFSGFHDVARISKNGGGVGVNLSKIRGSLSEIQGHKGASGGIVPWVKLLNDTAVAVNQLGKRAGAVTPSLDIWHIDIPAFLEVQTENGDQRKKAYDVFPQVVVVDEFMSRVESGSEWTLFCPYEVYKKTGIRLDLLWGEEFSLKYKELENRTDIELRKTVNAKELFKHVMKTWIETGMPYIAFKCTINKFNPNKHEGIIPAVNLCVESFSVVREDLEDDLEHSEAHTCNLVSINGANIDSDFPEVCMLSTRILDNTISLTTTPINASNRHNAKYRTIGVGMMGFADYAAKKKVTFSKSADLANELFEDFFYYTTLSSVELSRERGAYPAFKGSEWDKGLINCRSIDWYDQNTKNPERWHSLKNMIEEYGIRNSHIQAIAPNTSTALIQGCTPSVLPIYSKFYYDKNGTSSVPIAPPFIKSSNWMYQEYKNIDQKLVIDVISNIQKWVDTGISFEFLFNLNNPKINAKYIYECALEAWKKGCKTIYYIRSIQKSSETSEKSSAEDCSSCAG